MPKPLLSVNNLCLEIGDNKVINQLKLSLNKGELISIIGTSGCGKSSLLKVLAGITPHQSGDIFLNENKVNNVNYRRGCFGYMPQQDALLPFRSLIDNITLTMELTTCYTKSQAREIALPLLKAFNLSESENKLPGELSGGMKRRAALLRTWLSNDNILLIDEPFNGLDIFTRTKLYHLLASLKNKADRSIIMVSHDIEEAITLSNRVLLMQNGYIKHEEKISPSKYKHQQHKNNILGVYNSLIT